MLTLALWISYITLRYICNYHMFLLTNFSAIIWQQIVFVPLLLIKLLSSIKTVVPGVVNTSQRTRTGENERCLGKEWKVPKWAKGGMKQKRLGATVLMYSFRSHIFKYRYKGKKVWERFPAPKKCMGTSFSHVPNSHPTTTLVMQQVQYAETISWDLRDHG